MKRFLLLVSVVCCPLFSNLPDVTEVQDNNPLKVKTKTLENRQVKKIRLKNGVEAILISDPEANKSAAAVAVEVGSWQDPEQYPGTAHFCEHMLFMGSKTYPEEDGFFKRVSDSGGSANAYTWTDRTVYAFSSNHKKFNENLDVFAHFFIDPLFNQSSVDRELLAVNQEYAKNIDNDGWRQWSILKENCNPKHPNSKFSTGNAETLGIIPVETLANWYRLNYSADKIHLVIYANQDLNTLTQVVNQSFSAVPTSNPPQTPYDEILSEQQKGSITYIEPVRDLREVTFVWEVCPKMAMDIDGQVPEMVSYALAYKGEGSLFKELYDDSLAENLGSHVMHMRNDQMFIELSIELTKKGVEHVDRVIEETYAAIAHFQKNGVPSYMYEEMQKMAEQNYSWQQRSNEFNFAMSTASEMIDEDLETYPYKSRVIQTFRPAQIKEAFSQMTPQKTMIVVTAPSSMTKKTPNRKEQWLGGEYIVEKMSDDRIDHLTAVKPSSSLSAPRPNRYIADTLRVRNHTQKPEQMTPDLLSEDSFGKCYYLEDHHYLAPEVVIKCGLKSPAIAPTAKSAVMTDIAVEMLNRKLIAMTSQTTRAGISTSVYPDNLKLMITVRGPMGKSGMVLTEIADSFKGMCPTRKEFELIKESLLSSYQNSSKELAFTQAKEMMEAILFNQSFTGRDLENALNSVTFEDYLVYNEELTQSQYAEGVISGNVSRQEALSYWLSLKTTLKPLAYPVCEQHESKTLLLSKSEGPYRISERSSMQGNSALLMIQYPTTSISTLASQQVFSQILWSTFFDTLRTKQQTGYIAKAWTEEKDDKIMLFFGVQSTTHYPEELLARYELYLEELVRNFDADMPQDRFDSLKETVITKLSQPPTNMSQKTAELYYLGFEKQADFERRQRLIEAINSLSREQFRDDVASFVSRNNHKRIATLIQGTDRDEKAFSYQAISMEKAKSF